MIDKPLPCTPEEYAEMTRAADPGDPMVRAAWMACRMMFNGHCSCGKSRRNPCAMMRGVVRAVREAIE